jgi:uncharacterized membrane protein
MPNLLVRVLAWFRHTAWATVLMGLILIFLLYWSRGDFATTDNAEDDPDRRPSRHLMALNVWVFIWPNQKKIIGAMRAGQAPDPSWGRTALYASRANFTMSFPMLLFMGAASHIPHGLGGHRHLRDHRGGHRRARVDVVQRWMATTF